MITHLGFSRRAPVYLCYPEIIINSVIFYTQQYPGLNDKYGHSMCGGQNYVLPKTSTS